MFDKAALYAALHGRYDYRIGDLSMIDVLKQLVTLNGYSGAVLVAIDPVIYVDYVEYDDQPSELDNGNYYAIWAAGDEADPIYVPAEEQARGVLQEVFKLYADKRADLQEITPSKLAAGAVNARAIGSFHGVPVMATQNLAGQALG